MGKGPYIAGLASSTPTPNFRRMMIFIDGENLVHTFEKLLEDGYEPKSHTKHLEKVYVWNHQSINPNRFEILSANYYTYAIGDDKKIESIKEEIRSLSFIKDRMSTLPDTLKPVVFKKPKQASKTKGVDIKMTVDILLHCYNDNLDTVCLVAGDGDYLPIIEEVNRSGKQIYLAFFNKGLNKTLLNYVDQFICLDNIYF